MVRTPSTEDVLPEPGPPQQIVEHESSKLRGVSKVGPGGHPSQKQKRPSSKNSCSVHEVTMAKPLSRDAEDGEGSVFLHDRPVGAAAEVEATTTSSRNRNNFGVPEGVSGRWHPTQRSARTL